MALLGRRPSLKKLLDENLLRFKIDEFEWAARITKNLFPRDIESKSFHDAHHYSESLCV